MPRIAVRPVAAAGAAFYWKRGNSGRIDSIAVLPLENHTNDPNADYISDGVTESINDSLAQLPGLKVVPHSVASHYKGASIDAQKIGEELHVQSVLTGRVGQQGDDLTIGVELDDIRNGTQLWGQQYHRKVADLLPVQQEIAREVSQHLRAQTSAADQQKLTKGSTENPEAYQLYLKGKYNTNLFTKDGFTKGLEEFTQAIAIDPNYGLAYDGLAYNYLNQDDWYIRPKEAGPRAKAAAQKALAINEADSDAHVSLAIEEQWYDWDYTAADRDFQRAIALNPDNAEARTYYSWLLAPLGRVDEALAQAKRAVEISPFFPLSSFTVGSIFVFNRQGQAAVEQLRTAKALAPTFWFNPCFLGRAYEQTGQLPEAIAEFRLAQRLDPDNTEIWSGLGHAYAAAGKRAEAQKILEHFREMSAQRYVAPYSVAIVYAGLGDKNAAIAWLEKAFQERSYYIPAYLVTDSRLDTLHADPRFADLRKRAGLP
jgi:eukaryotic-like serine/threonine-protein kinase